jgi:hypothetical protein
MKIQIGRNLHRRIERKRDRNKDVRYIYIYIYNYTYRVIPSVLNPRKCEYFKDYPLDFE